MGHDADLHGAAHRGNRQRLHRRSTGPVSRRLGMARHPDRRDSGRKRLAYADVLRAEIRAPGLASAMGGAGLVVAELLHERAQPTLDVMTDASWRTPDPHVVERAGELLGDRRWLVLT